MILFPLLHLSFTEAMGECLQHSEWLRLGIAAVVGAVIVCARPREPERAADNLTSEYPQGLRRDKDVYVLLCHRCNSMGL